ncbi:hypothetical protein COUCH_02585 [Couchioplanes caeruleus]|uniref:hypothetical protein n=1 Tax=Couchioplanes caeruleus TaxID=56438 RepID=UPI0020BDA25D|nr:hypothetical protein [Couchioplanes caeruleus]UQU65250.1 hypothetical protein COUCH_02585 [Couchioplanes caeruleus]
MQPIDPPAQPALPPPTPAAAPPKPRNRRTRLILAMVGGILALLCLGGVGVFISFYDESTKIERNAPDAVVDNFIAAYLVNRNDEESKLYTCKDPELSQLAGLREEMLNRERKFGVTVTVTWESLRIGAGQDAKNVGVDLTIAGSTNGQPLSRRTETWDFHVVDEDGWRVCGADKTS